MSFLNNIFKKKKDDFSFDENEFKIPQDSTSDNNLFGDTTSDPFGNTQGNDPFSTQTNNNSFDHAMQQATQQASPELPPIDQNDQLASRGTQIAQNYIKQQQTSQNNQQTTPNQTTQQNNPNEHVLEMINLKLDAIKSQLEVLNHRLEKVENKKQW
jgi:hypothetical protein